MFSSFYNIGKEISTYPFHVNEVLLGRHEEVEDAFDELVFLHDLLEAGRRQ